MGVTSIRIIIIKKYLLHILFNQNFLKNAPNFIFFPGEHATVTPNRPIKSQNGGDGEKSTKGEHSITLNFKHTVYN